jgi:hypothetical protein
MELFKRVKAILLTPHAEWSVIAQEKSDASALFIRYVAILALIPALARFIGTSLIGWYAPILSSLAGALATYVSAFAVVYILALIIDVLAPRFGAQKDFARAVKLAVYSSTPVWIAGIFLLVPGLSFLVILGLHGATGKATDVAPGFWGLYTLSNGSTIFVAPEASGGLWSAAADTTFVDDILKAVEADLCIDTSRIFANGFSYGGAMSYEIACDPSTVSQFRGVVQPGFAHVSKY